MATEVTAADITAVKTWLSEDLAILIKEEFLSLKLSDMEYQGFDPIYLLAVLWKRGSAAGVERKQHDKDIRTLAILGTIRGGKISSILNKSKDNLVTWLNQMQQRYGLVSGKPESNKDATLLRIASCFAGQIFKALESGALAFPATVSPSDVVPNFPRGMCLPTFGSIIPKNSLSQEDTQLLVKGFLYHQALFDKVVNARSVAYTDKSTLENYVTIQVNSQLLNEQQRIDLLSGSNYIVADKGAFRLSDSMRLILKVASDKWDDYKVPVKAVK